MIFIEFLPDNQESKFSVVSNLSADKFFYAFEGKFLRDAIDRNNRNVIWYASCQRGI